MEKIEKRVLRLKAISDLQRIMASYSNYLSGAQFADVIDLFSRREDVTVTMPWGTYMGQAGLRRLYPGLYQSVLCGDTPGTLCPGVLDVHGMNTPTIQVAENEKTARGLWTSPGMFILKDDQGANGLQSYWSWQKTDCDFIYEDGCWRIWHLHIYALLTSAYEQSWVESQRSPYNALDPKFLPDQPALQDRQLLFSIDVLQRPIVTEEEQL